MRPTYTTRDSFNETLCILKATFAAGRTKDLAWRKWQLKQLWWMIVDNEQRIINALKHDLNRSEAESRRLELFTLKEDILSTLKSFEAWAADEKPGSWMSLNRMLGVRIRKDPLGVALIIGSWNYPFLLLLQPVVAAIAAGCCVVMKPSELATASEQLLAELVSTYLDGSAVMLATGGPEEMTWILECQYNHIFFTGSSRTARVIAAAAARHLTPTVLELGGQGPAIVCKTADVDLAAKRIAWAKTVNAGQICLTVNHVFADPCIYDEFAQRLRHWMTVFAAQSGGLPSIINERHFDRVQGLLGSTHGTVISLGQADRARLAIPLTMVTNVTLKGTFKPLDPRIFALQ
ncbi:Aldehyde dehydrogenase family 3 member B1 [Fonsecaea pedrosoi]|nr:Aldehyde dehydrogenase family 3 member B1 [Fonsecaea pedrosoi]